jgi:hypothetical protein
MKKTLLIIAGFSLVAPALADETPAPVNAPAPQESASPATNEATQEATAPAPTGGTVARATFTKAVEEREPVDSVDMLTTDASKVYFFTELRDMAGQTVTHRWEHDGKVMAEVPFTVNGTRWRVFSSKNLEPSWTGEWKVSVVDEGGGTLAVNTFTYEKGAETPAPAPAEAEPATAETAPANQ